MTKQKVNRRNKVIDLKKFTKRITNWTDFNSLASVAENFLKDGEDKYGVEFIIKRNNISKQFAVFVHEKNELKRVDDRMFKYNIGDLLLSKLKYKREGISVFTTYLKH